ncbi:DUF465 domain-containing protein [Aquibium sp. A9E412]|uniref:YdcH family protein n=1 Tax=Aquibium sp. A9E412 TaxID=2976767 RepID=UPI0025AF1480|nr:DUF465 domain-containing protein [Aquibium sp. A9E412]MDN2564671.1 DUF465 domain-containing protein [Aquibium sp. A9E412]
MSNTPHELAEDFPQYVSLMHHLRETDAHFARLSHAYHEINRAIHRAETDIEPVDDFRMAEMRKERMRLKDELYTMMARHEPVPESPTES